MWLEMALGQSLTAHELQPNVCEAAEPAGVTTGFKEFYEENKKSSTALTHRQTKYFQEKPKLRTPSTHSLRCSTCARGDTTGVQQIRVTTSRKKKSTISKS